MSTKTRLVIEGTLITKIEVKEGTNYDGSVWHSETTHGAVNVEGWLEQVLAARGAQTFIPPLTEGRIIAQKTKGDREVVIVELPPSVRRVIEKVDQHAERMRFISFPWIYLVVYFSRRMVDLLYLFYRNTCADRLDAEMCRPNLPNVYSTGQICTGSVSGLEPTWSLAQKLDWLVQNFWDSQFNVDLIDQCWRPAKRLSGHPQSFAEWEERSQTTPEFILGINWCPLGTTIQQVLDEGVSR